MNEKLYYLWKIDMSQIDHLTKDMLQILVVFYLVWDLLEKVYILYPQHKDKGWLILHNSYFDVSSALA